MITNSQSTEGAHRSAPSRCGSARQTGAQKATNVANAMLMDFADILLLALTRSAAAERFDMTRRYRPQKYAPHTKIRRASASASIPYDFNLFSCAPANIDPLSGAYCLTTIEAIEMLRSGLDIRELKLGSCDTTAIRMCAWELATGYLSLGIQFQLNKEESPADAAIRPWAVQPS
jgi:hypothetical protein